MVSPTDSLQSLVNAKPAGTTFILLPGVHHDSVTSLKNGDSFTGQPGAVENGATVLTGWTQVTIGGTQYWTTAGGTPLIWFTLVLPGESTSHEPGGIQLPGGVLGLSGLYGTTSRSRASV